jgi:hypothetical protein
MGQLILGSKERTAKKPNCDPAQGKKISCQMAMYAIYIAIASRNWIALKGESN